MDESSRRILDKLTRELGSVVSLLHDPTVIEIILNSDGEIWVERLGQDMEFFAYMPVPVAESIIKTIAKTAGVILSDPNPILECELPIDGSRFAGLLPPVVSAPAFAIRKRAVQIFTLDDYVSQGIMSEYHKEVIEAAARQRKNMLIAGSTGSGKTTLVNAVIAHIAKVCPQDRLIIMEDTLELQCAKRNTQFLKSTVDVSLERLLKTTMRLRPDRIIVGEVRDKLATLALLRAWNTGHSGGVSTLHSNSAYESLTRIEQLVSEITASSMSLLISQAVDLVIYIENYEGKRRVTEVMQVDGFDGQRYETKILEVN